MAKNPYARFAKKQETFIKETNQEYKDDPEVTEALEIARKTDPVLSVTELTETNVPKAKAIAILEVTREKMAPSMKEIEPT